MANPIEPFDIFSDVNTSNGLTAILSVASEDKPVVPGFVQDLYANGFRHFRGSEGTMKLVDSTLRDAGIGDKIDAGEVTVKKVGEVILNHLIATLYSPTHGGLLALPGQQEEMSGLGLEYFQLAFVSFYRLADAVKNNGGCPAVVGDTDMGGPALASSAAKGQRVVIVDPADCAKVVAWLRDGRPDSFNFMEELRAKAYFEIARYRFTSALFHGGDRYFALFGEKVADLKYGENPQQTPALHYKTGDDALALHRFEEIDAKPASLVNNTDIDGAVESLVRTIATVEWNAPNDRPPFFAVAVKHANPCGAAFGNDPVDVAERLIAGDDVAIFGGVIATNFPVDLAVAKVFRKYRWESGETMRPIDGVVAPAISGDAIEILRRKGNRGRLLQNGAMASIDMSSVRQEPAFRQVRGGVLIQPQPPLTDLGHQDREEFGPKPTDSQLLDALLGIGVCSTTKSNTITIVNNGMVIANAAGGQDRAFAAEMAVLKARKRNHPLAGATAVSDSYFPFTDGLKILIDAGVTFIVATSGSVNDNEVRDLALSSGITFWRIPDKLFRMFSGH